MRSSPSNARYESVRAAVLRYAKHYQLPVQRRKEELPPEDQQLTVDQLIDHISGYGPDRFAAEILKNRARTSSQSGILKAEAALRFAEVLRVHDVQVLQDLHGRSEDMALDMDLRIVKGQGSGIAVRYFFMLTGADHLIKPDRMILGSLERQLHRSVGPLEAQTLFTAAAQRLLAEHPTVTAQGLDYAIWSSERIRPKAPTRSSPDPAQESTSTVHSGEE